MIKNFIVRSQFKSHLFSWFRAEQAEQGKINKNWMPNTAPAVSPETSKEEFKKRYANLMLNMLILTIFRDWDNRHKPNEKTMMDFIKAVYGDPAILVRFGLSK